MDTLLSPLADWFRIRLTAISLAFVATFLMIFGTPLLKLLGGWMRRFKNRWARVGIFIVVCSVGMAYVTDTAVTMLRQLLGSLNDVGLLGTLALAVVLLGLAAESEKLLPKSRR